MDGDFNGFWSEVKTEIEHPVFATKNPKTFAINLSKILYLKVSEPKFDPFFH